MCASSPLYSRGERMSTIGLPRCASTSSLNARRVVALDNGVLDRGRPRRVGRDLATFGDPQGATAVEQADVLVTEQGQDPERVRGPPVALVAIDDHCRVPRDA